MMQHGSGLTVACDANHLTPSLTIGLIFLFVLVLYALDSVLGGSSGCVQIFPLSCSLLVLKYSRILATRSKRLHSIVALRIWNVAFYASVFSY